MFCVTKYPSMEPHTVFSPYLVMGVIILWHIPAPKQQPWRHWPAGLPPQHRWDWVSETIRSSRTTGPDCTKRYGYKVDVGRSCVYFKSLHDEQNADFPFSEISLNISMLNISQTSLNVSTCFAPWMCFSIETQPALPYLISLLQIMQYKLPTTSIFRIYSPIRWLTFSLPGRSTWKRKAMLWNLYYENLIFSA